MDWAAKASVDMVLAIKVKTSRHQKLQTPIMPEVKLIWINGFKSDTVSREKKGALLTFGIKLVVVTKKTSSTNLVKKFAAVAHIIPLNPKFQTKQSK